jgi:hypothetical protein
MEMAAIPATTPPTMAPTFVLLPPEFDEDPVKDGLGEVVVDTPEGPKIAPGPYSGLSISNVGEIVTEKEKIGDMMLTACLIRCVGVPIVLFLEYFVNTLP